jgi:membrane protease YdiL (CAAX protease family)
MLTLLVVIAFPLLLGAGYAVLFVYASGDRTILTGPVGFLLYMLLVTIPTAFVLWTHSSRVYAAVAWRESTLLFVLPAALLGIALWGVQVWGLPGRTPDASERVWAGPAGPTGFALLLICVTYIVLAEELVWRAFLIPEVGLPLSAVFFSLHHYHFGLRHVVFSCIAGLIWGVLFVMSESLWPAAGSHLVYNILAWHHMRRSQFAT